MLAKMSSNLSKSAFQRTAYLTKSSTKIQSRYHACYISNSQTADTIMAYKIEREKNSKLTSKVETLDATATLTHAHTGLTRNTLKR